MRRQYVGFRIGSGSLAEFDEQALRAGYSRSAAAREAFVLWARATPYRRDQILGRKGGSTDDPRRPPADPLPDGTAAGSGRSSSSAEPQPFGHPAPGHPPRPRADAAADTDGRTAADSSSPARPSDAGPSADPELEDFWKLAAELGAQPEEEP